MPFTIHDLYLLSIDHVLNLQSKSAVKIFANKLIALHKSWRDRVRKLKVLCIFVYWHKEYYNWGMHSASVGLDTELVTWLLNKFEFDFFWVFNSLWAGARLGKIWSRKLLLWWRWRASRAPLCFYSRAESGWNSFLPTHPTMEREGDQHIPCLQEEEEEESHHQISINSVHPSF